MKPSLKLALLVLTGLALASCVSPSGTRLAGGADSGGEAYIAVEAHSGKILSNFNSTASRPVATLTQVATAIVIFDWSTATGQSLAELAVVPPEVSMLGGANPMGLQPGDQIALRDGLYSMLMGSDSAAAQTLANHVGAEILRRRGSAGGQPVDTFVNEMNQLAVALGMSRTRFESPHGLDSSGGKSTAEDIARLGIYAMRHPGIAFYTKQKSRRIGFLRAGQQLAFNVSNTNTLVGRDGIDGLKAGQTPQSGPCILISAERPGLVEKLADGQSRITPRRMIIVALQSPNREGRAYGLLTAGWPIYDQWVTIKNSGIADPSLQQEILSVPNLQ